MSTAPRTNYQTHSPERPGMSDSQLKLTRLGLPSDLTGKTVLDIGCNEGFFCNEAASRGAVKVVGIDGHRPFLDIAERNYPNKRITFVHGRWSTLPDGQFDVVLWTSAMHYEKTPGQVINQIRTRLAVGGLFILECGVLDWPSKEMVLRARHDHSLWYPTWPLLSDMLRDFAVRRVAPPEVTVGDSVPRAVFHCTTRKPVVLLLRGRHLSGKSGLASSLAASATKTISCDGVFVRILQCAHHNTRLEQFVRDNFGDRLYDEIDESGLTSALTKLLIETIEPCDKLVVIEGALTEPQAGELSKQLQGFAHVWDAQRR